ncbi:hypothetical protein KSX_44650 [Ktedonospora formicarum]|uniref:Uncharacterized protein n=2 Tax=Ktedonospora formicarum TaxID=2778364 RepID=A0A8J3MRP0_9CHLR|nr:hypothetical protein KSX_44650 [Ktedonospora formicarum]
MPKAKALAVSRWLKRCMAITALVGFGTLSGLVMTHKVASDEQQSTLGNSSSSDESTAQPQSPYATTSPWEQGGYGFGNSDPEQPPISRSHAS